MAKEPITRTPVPTASASSSADASKPSRSGDRKMEMGVSAASISQAAGKLDALIETQAWDPVGSNTLPLSDTPERRRLKRNRVHVPTRDASGAAPSPARTPRRRRRRMARRAESSKPAPAAPADDSRFGFHGSSQEEPMSARKALLEPSRAQRPPMVANSEPPPSDGSFIDMSKRGEPIDLTSEGRGRA